MSSCVISCLRLFALAGLLRHRWIVAILAVGSWVAELIITWDPALNAQVNIFTATDGTRFPSAHTHLPCRHGSLSVQT